MRFVAVGELLVDVVASGSGHQATIRTRAGGSAFNAAATAAALGAETMVVGAVGDDPGGRMILAELERLGIRAAVEVGAGRTGTFLSTDGEIRVERGVSRELSLPRTIEADAVLVSGYLRRETIEAALTQSESSWVALDAARLSELPAGGDALIANEEAARSLTGLGPKEAALALGARYRLACVTRGADGAVAVLDGHAETAAATPVDEDAPGAGDAFAAALLMQLVGQADLAEALAAACRRGAQAAAQS
jgi:ribokinase